MPAFAGMTHRLRVAPSLSRQPSVRYAPWIAGAGRNHDGRRMVRFRNVDAVFADDRVRQMDRASPFHNARPRDPNFYEDPIRARALGAHQNGIEAFPFFAIAVLLAEFRLGSLHLIDELAVLFLIVRIAYVFTYLGNRPTLRTILSISGLRSMSRSSSCRRCGGICRCEEDLVCHTQVSPRHCEERQRRRDPYFGKRRHGLLPPSPRLRRTSRFARNDGEYSFAFSRRIAPELC